MAFQTVDEALAALNSTTPTTTPTPKFNSVDEALSALNAPTAVAPNVPVPDTGLTPPAGQLEAATPPRRRSVFDTTLPTAEPAPADTTIPHRGVIGETLTTLPRAVGETAQMFGKATQAASGEKYGAGMRKWGEEVSKDYEASPAYAKEHPWLSTINQAVEGAAPLLANEAVVAGLTAGATAFPPLAPVLAPAAYTYQAASLPAIFGLSRYQTAKEEGLKQGMTPEEASQKAILPAAVEGGLFAAMPFVGKYARTLIPKEAMSTVSDAAGKLIASPTVGRTVKNLAATAAIDTPYIFGQQYAVAKIEQETGIRPDAQPFKESLSGIPVNMLMGIGMGAAADVGERAKLRTMRNIISDPEANPKDRADASNFLAGMIHTVNPDAAQGFADHAADAIKNKEAIDLAKPINEFIPVIPDEFKQQVEQRMSDIEKALKGDNPSPDLNAELNFLKQNVERNSYKPIADAYGVDLTKTVKVRPMAGTLPTEIAKTNAEPAGGFGYGAKVRADQAFADSIGKDLPIPEAPPETHPSALALESGGSVDILTGQPTGNMKALKDTLAARRMQREGATLPIPVQSATLPDTRDLQDIYNQQLQPQDEIVPEPVPGTLMEGEVRPYAQETLPTMPTPAPVAPKVVPSTLPIIERAKAQNRPGGELDRIYQESTLPKVITQAKELPTNALPVPDGQRVNAITAGDARNLVAQADPKVAEHLKTGIEQGKITPDEARQIVNDGISMADRQGKAVPDELVKQVDATLPENLPADADKPTKLSINNIPEDLRIKNKQGVEVNAREEHSRLSSSIDAIKGLMKCLG